MSRSCLCGIDIAESNQKAIGQPESKAAYIHGNLVIGGDLDRASDGVQEAGQPEGDLAPEEVGEGPRNQ